MKINNKQCLSALFISVALTSMSANAGKPTGISPPKCETIDDTEVSCQPELSTLCDTIMDMYLDIKFGKLKDRDREGIAGKSIGSYLKEEQGKLDEAEGKLGEIEAKLAKLADSNKISEDENDSISAALIPATQCLIEEGGEL